MGKNAELPEFTFIFGLVIFAFMGAAVALIFEETNFRKAFFLGVGLPALFQVSATEITLQNNDKTYLQKRTIDSSQVNYEYPKYRSFENIAVAYPFLSLNNRIQSIQNRKLYLTFKPVVISASFPSPYFVSFQSPNGEHQKVKLDNISTESNIIEIPPHAQSFSVTLGGFRTNEIDLSAAQSNDIKAEVLARKKIWSGFFKALGLRGYKSYELILIKVPEDKTAKASHATIIVNNLLSYSVKLYFKENTQSAEKYLGLIAFNEKKPFNIETSFPLINSELIAKGRKNERVFSSVIAEFIEAGDTLEVTLQEK
jgi:hypothetical protein